MFESTVHWLLIFTLFYLIDLDPFFEKLFLLITNLTIETLIKMHVFLYISMMKGSLVYHK